MDQLSAGLWIGLGVSLGLTVGGVAVKVMLPLGTGIFMALVRRLFGLKCGNCGQPLERQGK